MASLSVTLPIGMKYIFFIDRWKICSSGMDPQGASTESKPWIEYPLVLESRELKSTSILQSTHIAETEV